MLLWIRLAVRQYRDWRPRYGTKSCGTLLRLFRRSGAIRRRGILRRLGIPGGGNRCLFALPAPCLDLQIE